MRPGVHAAICALIRDQTAKGLTCPEIAERLNTNMPKSCYGNEWASGSIIHFCRKYDIAIPPTKKPKVS